MLSFSEYFKESYDTVQDFLTNPIHNDKERWEWTKGFEADGGQVLGNGSYGAVYYHPKWPYVVKIFEQDDPYVKFLRWSMKNPHSAFPKMYGTPKRVIPPYKRRTEKNDKFYAVRLEKLKEISSDEFDLFMTYRHQLARYFYMMDNEFVFKNYYDERARPAYIEDSKRLIQSLPPNIVKVIYGYYLLYRANLDMNMGDEDMHQRNIMKRDNGEIVLADPLWYGYNPYAAADHQYKMEIDYYGGGEHDPEPRLVRGGKLRKPIRKKKPKPKPEPVREEPNDDDIPF